MKTSANAPISEESASLQQLKGISLSFERKKLIWAQQNKHGTEIEDSI